MNAIKLSDNNHGRSLLPGSVLQVRPLIEEERTPYFKPKRFHPARLGKVLREILNDLNATALVLQLWDLLEKGFSSLLDIEASYSDTAHLTGIEAVLRPPSEH
jgi:hypothetical protein